MELYESKKDKPRREFDDYRAIFLCNFEDTINRNMKIYNGKLNELRIENIKEDIERYKKCLADKEAELNKLLSDIKDYD